MLRRMNLFCFYLVLNSCLITTAQDTPPPANPVEAAAIQFSLTADEFEGLIGQKADLLFTTGKKEEGVTITGFATIKSGDRFSLVKYKTDGSPREKRLASMKLFQLTVAEKTYTANYLPSIRASALQDVEQLRTDIESRLNGQGQKLWAPTSKEDMEKYVLEEKEFLKKVGEHFPNRGMQFYETEYFLFFTDFPPNQVAPYLANLDKMNEVLGQSFGFAPGQNVWRGKAVVVAFVDKVAFQEFERKFMDYPETGDAQGLCHSFGNGRVVVGCYRGNNPSFFAALLVHETSHGYNHRYLSTVHIPSWINEGLAEWVATKAVPREREMNRRRQEATARLRQTGTLEGVLSNRVSGHWQYGAAHSMVDLLIRENPQQFRLFFNGIKHGLPWEDSLVRAYGATPADLVRLYGRAIGVPNLGP